MSETQETGTGTLVPDLSAYAGKDQYVDWAYDALGITFTGPQVEMAHSVAEHQKTLVMGANGFGKTYGAAGISLGFLYSNTPASVMATSGTYRKLKRTYCRPIEAMHKDSGLPGTYLGRPPHIDIEDRPDIFWEAASPRDAGELEGVHNAYTLGVVEEADKDDVDADVIDSMDSLRTDENDRLLVIANPPKDETNVVAEIRDDPTWNVLQYSSFDSHNVQVEMGNVDGEQIPKIVTLDQIEQDWRGYNGLDWPGLDEAMASGSRDDLDVRWYRRRLGIVPPSGSDVPRPFTTEEVEAAFRRTPEIESVTPTGLAWDVARGTAGGDFNAVGAWFERRLDVLDWWRHTGEHPHLANEETVRGLVADNWHADFAIDAVGVGSESYDRVSQWYPETVRWDAGGTAAEPTKYTNRWTESLCTLGAFLRDGAGFTNERLREEMLTAARVVEKDETYSAKYDTTRYACTPKDEVKQRLGRSPDLLDAAAMAAVMASGGGRDSLTVPGTW